VSRKQQSKKKKKEHPKKMLLYSGNYDFNFVLYNQVEFEKLIFFNLLPSGLMYVLKVGSRKLGFLIIEPISCLKSFCLLTLKLQFCYISIQGMVVCIENIQSNVGFVAILLRSGVIHWPAHPYILPCFTGQDAKGCSI